MTFAEFALLFGGSILAALISGSAGFGGALLLLPLLVQAVGTSMAVPLLTVAQLVGNLTRVYIGYSHIAWRSVATFLVVALPMSALGSLLFLELPAHVMKRSIGIAILCFVAFKWLNRGKIKLGERPLLFGGGAIVGFLSGLIGSAGPLGAAVFLELKLPPIAYLASEASAATAIHIVKTVVYRKALSVSSEQWILALILGLGMVVGTILGKRITEKMSRETFQKFVTALLIVLAVQMIVFG